MILWLRVRRAPACVATIISVVVALIAAGNLSLTLPSLLGGYYIAVPLAVLLPLAVAVVVAWGLSAGDSLLEAVSSRPLRVFDTAYAVTASIMTFIGCFLARAIGGPDFVLAAARNSVAYVGLALLGRRVIGPHGAPLLPACYVILIAVAGHGTDRQPLWWAWPLATAADTRSWIIAGLLLLIGAMVALLRLNSMPSEP